MQRHLKSRVLNCFTILLEVAIATIAPGKENGHLKISRNHEERNSRVGLSLMLLWFADLMNVMGSMNWNFFGYIH